MNSAQKEFLKTAGVYCLGAMLVVLNVYLVFELLAATKSYTVREREAVLLKTKIDGDVGLIRRWKEDELLLKMSRIAKERCLVENYSITLHPGEKILTIPAEYVDRQPLPPER